MVFAGKLAILAATVPVIFGSHGLSGQTALAVEAVHSPPWYFKDLHIDEIWRAYGTGADVVIAVIDDGVSAHPALKGSFWKPPNKPVPNAIYDGTYVESDVGLNFIPQLEPKPIGRHGTFVAGVIAGHGAIATGIAPGVRIMPLIVCTSAGECSVPAAVRAIYFAVNNGAQVINISVATKKQKGYVDEFDAAIKYAISKNVDIVAAAGNSISGEAHGTYFKTSTLLSPVCNDDTIGVGASNAAREIASWSNYGSQCVDVYAPGESIVSLAVPSASSSDLYKVSAGTSFSAAIVSSLIAILRSNHPELSAREVRARIIRAGPITNAKAIFAPLARKTPPENTPPAVPLAAAPEKAKQEAATSTKKTFWLFHFF